MLSRVAENIYWMARYLERASNLARITQVNFDLMLDGPAGQPEQWDPLVRITGEYDAFIETYGEATRDTVLQHLTFDENYPNSICRCLSACRENARAVREHISPPFWEELNELYHLATETRRMGFSSDREAVAFYAALKQRSMHLGGVASDTMLRDEGFNFFRMGAMLERADKTSRLLDVKYFILLPTVELVGSVVDELQWGAVLRSLEALELFRRRYGSLDPDTVSKFLLLDGSFPHSVIFGLREVESNLRALSGGLPNTYCNGAEQRLGQVCAELSYLSIEQVFKRGLHEYIDHLQSEMNAVDDQIFQTFFAIDPA